MIGSVLSRLCPSHELKGVFFYAKNKTIMSYKHKFLTHHVNMRNEPKIKALKNKFGNEGYGIYNCLLEVIIQSYPPEIEYSKLSFELHAGDFMCNPTLLKDIILYCLDIQLLKFTNKNSDFITLYFPASHVKFCHTCGHYNDALSCEDKCTACGVYITPF